MPHILDGNTGFGITSRMNLVSCPRSYHLDQERRAAKALAGFQQVYSNMSNDVGSVCHAMLDTHHSGKEDDGIFMDGEGELIEVGERTLEKAVNILEWYRPNYPVEAWGKVLETERLLDSDEIPGMDEAIGFRDGRDQLERYTCKIDLTVEMSEDDVKRINSEEVSKREAKGRGKDKVVTITRPTLPGPGVYACDYKVYQAEHSYLGEYFGPGNIQFTAYQLAHIHTYGAENYQGFLAIVIIKTREPQLRVMYVPPPDVHQLSVFAAFQANYTDARKRILNEGFYANNHQCFNWFRLCTHLGAGCERY